VNNRKPGFPIKRNPSKLSRPKQMKIEYNKLKRHTQNNFGGVKYLHISLANGYPGCQGLPVHTTN